MNGDADFSSRLEDNFYTDRDPPARVSAFMDRGIGRVPLVTDLNCDSIRELPGDLRRNEMTRLRNGLIEGRIGNVDWIP